MRGRSSEYGRQTSSLWRAPHQGGHIQLLPLTAAGGHVLSTARVSDFLGAVGNWSLWVKGTSLFAEVGNSFKNLKTNHQRDLSVDCIPTSL